MDDKLEYTPPFLNVRPIKKDEPGPKYKISF